MEKLFGLFLLIFLLLSSSPASCTETPHDEETPNTSASPGDSGGTAPNRTSDEPTESTSHPPPLAQNPSAASSSGTPNPDFQRTTYGGLPVSVWTRDPEFG